MLFTKCSDTFIVFYLFSVRCVIWFSYLIRKMMSYLLLHTMWWSHLAWNYYGATRCHEVPRGRGHGTLLLARLLYPKWCSYLAENHWPCSPCGTCTCTWTGPNGGRTWPGPRGATWPGPRDLAAGQAPVPQVVLLLGREPLPACPARLSTTMTVTVVRSKQL